MTLNEIAAKIDEIQKQLIVIIDELIYNQQITK